MTERKNGLNSLELLRTLVSFRSVSGTSNLDMATWIENVLGSYGIEYTRFAYADGERVNLWATIGPKDVPGVVLSGHLDVVPAASDGSHDPFTMEVRDGLAFGRGTTDMKGFVACAMRAASIATCMPLRRPVHLAFSYDEEFGCTGVRHMLDGLAQLPTKPLFCLIGEPTEMRVVVAHKGKVSGRIRCHGVHGHSSDPASGVSAIHLAAEIVQAVRDIQNRLTEERAAPDFTVPFTTIHVGKIIGGSALNVIPALCDIEFEIRNAPHDNADRILEELQQRGDAAAARLSEQASVEICVDNQYPPLDTDPGVPASSLLLDLLGQTDTLKVSYGTEAGLYSRRLGVPALVCGPGSVAQAHRSSEFINLQQITACDDLLERLLSHLTTDSEME